MGRIEKFSNLIVIFTIASQNPLESINYSLIGFQLGTLILSTVALVTEVQVVMKSVK
jgi:hypothetical protein